MPKLNREELVMGALVGVAFAGILKWWTIVTVPMCAWLWAYGGAEGTSKAYRRVGVPLLLAMLTALTIKSPWVLASAVTGWVVLSLGYGLPGINDEGSRLGRFWYYYFNEDMIMADIATRASVGGLLGLAFFPLAFWHVWWWLLGGVLLFFGVPIIEELVK